MHAEEVIHKRADKKIEYKNTWLKIYDKQYFTFYFFFIPTLQ